MRNTMIRRKLTSKIKQNPSLKEFVYRTRRIMKQSMDYRNDPANGNDVLDVLKLGKVNDCNATWFYLCELKDDPDPSTPCLNVGLGISEDNGKHLTRIQFKGDGPENEVIQLVLFHGLIDAIFRTVPCKKDMVKFIQGYSRNVKDEIDTGEKTRV